MLMTKTHHFDQRMNQRGITNEMVKFTLDYGEVRHDALVTNRKILQSVIDDFNAQIKSAIYKKTPHKLKELTHLKSIALKLHDKGGIAVIMDNGSLITTYHSDSYCRY